MVTGVCDYIYVLDQGTVICEGTPQEIQRDPRVIAAYLGEPSDAEVANACDLICTPDSGHRVQ